MNGLSEGLYLAINSAREIQTKYGLSYIGTEELLYAVLLTPKCDACAYLTEFGASRERVLPYLKNTLKAGGARGFTQNAKLALNGAKKFADASGDYATTEHLLLAILRLENCKAYKILAALGVDIPALYAFIFERTKKSKKNTETIKRQPQAERPSYSATMLKQRAEYKNSEVKQGEEKTVPLNAEPETEEKKHIVVSDTPLSGLGYDLTEKAREGKIDEVIGRNDEIDRIIRALSRKTKNAPVLVGEAGVGKSAVVEGLALKIAKGDVPEFLSDKILFSLDIGGLLAGTRYRGDFESRLKSAVDYATENGNVVFFIDEIHNLVGAGSTQDSKIDAAEILKPLLSRGEIMVIGATTPDEYTRYIEKDPALERRFQPIDVNEPTEDEAIEILKGIRPSFEKHHNVIISDEAITLAVKLSTRYLTDRRLPDKAIDVIDEASSEKHLFNDCEKDVVRLNKEIAALTENRDFALKRADLDTARRADRELSDKTELLKSVLRRESAQKNEIKTVNGEDIRKLISDVTGIPVTSVSSEESKNLIALESELKKRVIGQDQAISAVSRAVRRARANLKDPEKPMGTFIFVGPTGVGKSELSKALAECVFGSQSALIRFDMSEYQDKTSLNKLIGVAQGYVGYEEEGILTEKIRRKPYSVVLFDEIEKAHPDIFDLMLQILDEGRLTDSKGRTVSFKNALIVLTSNVGFSDDAPKNAVGFGSINEDREEQAYNALKKRFKPEFINRLDGIIPFNRLTKEDCKNIAGIIINGVIARVKESGVTVKVDESAIDVIVSEGYDSEYGARPLKRAVSRRLEDMLSDGIIEGYISKDDVISVYGENGEVKYKKEG